MLDVGSLNTRTCTSRGRRAVLKLGASLPLVLGTTGTGSAIPGSQSPGNVRPRAKSVIFVFLWGAPSHLDTFDPKPGAPQEYRGPFAPIATRTPGVQFTELLPRIAVRSDRFTLVRTHVTKAPGHPDAGTVALTGFEEKPEPVQPNFGSIVARHRNQSGDLPPFVSLALGTVMDGGRRIEGYGGGALGSGYDPFMVGCTAAGQVNIPALQLLEGLDPARIVDRRGLLSQLDQVPRALDLMGTGNWSRTAQQAYALLTRPDARNAFDLTRESAATRGRYGYTVFGQSALLARRLAEAGVPYIQLNYSRHVEAINPGFEFGWDTHIYNFELLQDLHCPILDRAFSALLDDLYDRGLGDDTLVVCMGEFGRTPRINSRAARDHWTGAYFSLWAGAGIEPGRAIGASDNRGEYPVTDPVTPLAVGTTIAELAGLDTQARVELGVLAGGKVIPELI